MGERECLCEGEFWWACGPECECFHHSGEWQQEYREFKQSEVRRAAASQGDSLREARVMAAFDGWTAESGVTLREAIRAALAGEEQG